MKTSRFVAAVWFLMTASASSAATYNVTSQIAYGPGSLREAAKLANENPGEDTISISPGLKIDLSNWYKEPGCARDCSRDALSGVVHLADSTVIEGNGSTVFSQPYWPDPTGGVNIDSAVDQPDTIVTAAPEQFLQVGVRGVDSSNVEVTVRNLNAEGLHTFVRLWGNSNLTVDQIKISGIRSIAQLEGRLAGGFVFDVVPERALPSGGSVLTIRNSTIRDSKTYQKAIPITDDGVSLFSGAISGSGTLVMDNVFMDDNDTAGAIYWGGGNATIVSSTFKNSGGIQALGANVKIVNSAVALGRFDPAQLIAMHGSRIDLVASTVTLGSSGQGRPLRTDDDGIIAL